MSFKGVYTCDGCDKVRPAQGRTDLPMFWHRADLRVHDVPQMNEGQHRIQRDLCDTCLDRLPKMVDPLRWERAPQAHQEHEQPPHGFST